MHRIEKLGEGEDVRAGAAVVDRIAALGDGVREGVEIDDRRRIEGDPRRLGRAGDLGDLGHVRVIDEPVDPGNLAEEIAGGVARGAGAGSDDEPRRAVFRHA